MSKTSDFAGRRKGRPLKRRQKELLKELLPQLRLDLQRPAPDDLRTLFRQVDDVYLEIGFGGGEHLIARAQATPEAGFIGVEPFINGLAKTLAGIKGCQLSNIRLYDEDAGQLMDWLPESSLMQIALLYPDPWPKFRHWRRRFVSPHNLLRMARVLKPGGLFLFASDIEHYVAWTLNHCHQHPNYNWLASKRRDWTKATSGPWAGWPGTRYEAKALREGRLPTYLTFRLCK